MNYRCYQIILRVPHFYRNQEKGEVLAGYLSLGAGLAMTGRTRETGQKVLQSSFGTGSSSNPSYFQNFFLVVFLEKAFFKKYNNFTVY